MKPLTSILLLMILVSCREKEIEPLSLSERQKALRSIGYELIVPAFVTLQTTSNKLLIETRKYRGNPADQQQLEDLKAAWLNCMIACKQARVFRFAPRELEVSFGSLYEIPDTTGIEALLARTDGKKIDSTLIDVLVGGYKGLVAYEYALFGASKGDNQLIIKQFEDHDLGIRRLDYLLSVANVLYAAANRIVQKWSMGGDGYVNEFVLDDGLGVNGSMGVFYQALDRQLDLVRSERLGKPLGIFNDNQPQLNKVDGRWSNYSKFLLEADIYAFINAYWGLTVPDNNGIHTLVYAGGAKVGKANLSAEIDNTILRISEILTEITDPVDHMIAERPEPVFKLYEEIETLSGLFKTEVPLALGL